MRPLASSGGQSHRTRGAATGRWRAYGLYGALRPPYRLLQRCPALTLTPGTVAWPPMKPCPRIEREALTMWRPTASVAITSTRRPFPPGATTEADGTRLGQQVTAAGPGGHLCPRRQGQLPLLGFDECHPGQGGRVLQGSHHVRTRPPAVKLIPLVIGGGLAGRCQPGIHDWWRAGRGGVWRMVRKACRGSTR
jgi:hypothetical protein